MPCAKSGMTSQRLLLLKMPARKTQSAFSRRTQGAKVLIFTYYKDTARYLYSQLGSDDPAAVQWRASAGEPRIRRMDSGADAGSGLDWWHNLHLMQQ